MARLLVVWETTSTPAENLAVLMYETSKAGPAHHPAPNVWIVDANHTASSLNAYLATWVGYRGRVLVLDLVTHEQAGTGRSALDVHLLEEVLGRGLEPKVNSDGSRSTYGYGFGPEKPKHEMPWRTLGKPVQPDFKRRIDPK